MKKIYLLMLALFSGNALASGYAVSEQSASGLGNAYAGGAAVAEDASTVFSNPAGMSRLNGTQFAFALSGVDASVNFNNTQSVPAALQPLGGNGGNASGLNIIPAGYFSKEVTPRMRVGLAINIPFGLPTDYVGNWMGRFQSIRASLQAANVNPAISWDLNDKVSVGAGVSYQRLSGELRTAVNYSAAAFGAGGLPLLAAIGGAGVEGTSIVSGNDDVWGYNLGILYRPTEDTRLGLAYRSKVKHTLLGSVTFTNRPAALAAGIPDGSASLDITLPDNFSASIFHRLDNKWDVMADLGWTGWSSFKQLNILRANGATLANVPENWKDTWRISAGASYHYNDTWTARMGVAFDQSPVSDAYRTASIPDSDRTWLAVGGQYRMNKGSAFDFGYAHVFLNNATINQNLAAQGQGALVGNYSLSANVLSLQYNLKF